MFVHVHRLSKPLLVVLFLFSMPAGGWFFSEWFHAWKDSKSPHVEGTVLTIEEYRRFGGIPAARVTIQVDKTETVVFARIAKGSIKDLGKRVGFHYTGDPTREVYLDIEGPLFLVFGLAAFFVLTPFGLLLLYLKFKGRPGFEDVIV